MRWCVAGAFAAVFVTAHLWAPAVLEDGLVAVFLLPLVAFLAICWVTHIANDGQKGPGDGLDYAVIRGSISVLFGSEDLPARADRFKTTRTYAWLKEIAWFGARMVAVAFVLGMASGAVGALT
jgi:hypothetical protein